VLVSTWEITELLHSLKAVLREIFTPYLKVVRRIDAHILQRACFDNNFEIHIFVVHKTVIVDCILFTLPLV